jgi:hypothetical protein
MQTAVNLTASYMELLRLYTTPTMQAASRHSAATKGKVLFFSLPIKRNNNLLELFANIKEGFAGALHTK